MSSRNCERELPTAAVFLNASGSWLCICERVSNTLFLDKTLLVRRGGKMIFKFNPFPIAIGKLMKEDNY